MQADLDADTNYQNILNSSVSVVVCTRNRGASISSTVETILANKYQDFELIIIDQSTNDSTEEAVTPFLDNRRLRYIRSSTRGLSVARNIGLHEAQYDIVLMTDDDCDIPDDWIAKMVEIFVDHPQVTCVFCDVKAGDFDSNQGFIPYCIHKQETLVKGVTRYEPGAGIGAGMGIRRAATQALGGFDELLGAGMDFASGEELDLVLRLLLKGNQIYHTKKTSVIHYGFRTHNEGRKLMRGYMYGSSAVYAKILKCGHWIIIITYLKMIWVSIGMLILESLRQRKLPPILGRITHLVKGFIVGWQIPVNRTKILFTPGTHSEYGSNKKA